MKISEKFKSGKTLFAFELLPPLKGQSISNIFETVERLKIYDPAYINITYHQQQTELVEMGGGMLERRTVRKRPGTVAIAASIASRYGIDVVPHLICGGFSRSDIEDMLIDLSFLGIDNVLALRGDSQSGERSFTPHSKGHTHACELV
ncbi:MAG: methylenetetrahydrofolate reductase, partial [Mucinivorans sp.]